MITGSWMDHLFRHSGSLATGKTELALGQIIKGKVLQLLPERQALLQIGGMKVLAQLESTLEPGERVWLQVQATGQPIQLKAITRSEKGIIKNNSSNGQLADLAKALEFDSSPEHKELLTRLIHAKVPLTKDTISIYKSVLKEMGGESESIEMILLAVRRGMPLSKEVLQGLRAFFYGKGWTEMVNLLQQEIVQSFRQAPLSFSPEIRQKLELLLQQLEVFQSVEPTSADSIREGLVDIFKKMGLLDRMNEVEVVNRSTQTMNITDLLEELRKTLSLIPHGEKVSDSMEKIIQFVRGQQLMVSSSENGLQQLVLHIPLMAFQNHSFLQIEAKKRGNGEMDPDHCRLLFCLEMSHLGDIMLDVRIVNRIVSINVVGQQQEKLRLFPMFKEQLLDGLKNLGYQLSSLKISQDPGATGQDPIQRGIALPYNGVDLRI